MWAGGHFSCFIKCNNYYKLMNYQYVCLTRYRLNLIIDRIYGCTNKNVANVLGQREKCVQINTTLATLNYEFISK